MTASLHPAMTVAMEIYDRKGDLEPHQRDFLTEVHWSGNRLRMTVAGLIQDFGHGSSAYVSGKRLAERQQDYELTKALTQYQAAHQQLLEIT